MFAGFKKVIDPVLVFQTSFQFYILHLCSLVFCCCSCVGVTLNEKHFWCYERCAENNNWNKSIPYPKEVHFYHHHCRAQKDILNYMWGNLTITLSVPESQTLSQAVSPLFGFISVWSVIITPFVFTVSFRPQGNAK